MKGLKMKPRKSVASGFQKRELAIKQLRRAVQLFNQADFVCAGTLAGAAEEILGRMARKRADTTALDGDMHFWSQVADMVGKPPPGRKKIVDAHNRIRNQLKHNESGDNEWVTADFEFEAQDLIDRAIRNYWLAYDTPPTDRIVNNYVQVHWP
jgi:hypothetical protein